MKAMKIDFAPRTVRRALLQIHPAVLALACVGVLLGASAALGGWQLAGQRRERAHQLQHQRERVASLSALAARPADSAKQAAIPEAQASFVNGAILQLNLPWGELQDAVLAATPRSVALVAMEPDPRKRVLNITAEAKSSEDMVDYVAQLKQQDIFTDVALTRHEINEQDPNRPLRFQLEATWQGR